MVSFPLVSPPRPYTPPLSSPIRPSCPAHLIHLDFITRTILGEEYKSFSSSLCNLLHSPVTSSLLGPNKWHTKLNYFYMLNSKYMVTINLYMTLHEIGGFHNGDVEISVFWDVIPCSYSETSACPPSCMVPIHQEWPHQGTVCKVPCPTQQYSRLRCMLRAITELIHSLTKYGNYLNCLYMYLLCKMPTCATLLCSVALCDTENIPHWR